MRKSPKFSPEVVERAVRMVFDAKDQYPSQWAYLSEISRSCAPAADRRSLSPRRKRERAQLQPHARIDWRTGRPMQVHGAGFWKAPEARRVEQGLSVAAYCEANGLAKSTFRRRASVHDRAALPDAVETLKDIVMALAQQVQAVRGQADAQLEVLRHQLAELRRRLFGPRSEAIHPGQAELWSDKVALPLPPEVHDEVSSHKRRRQGRPAIDADVPRRRVEYDLSEADRAQFERVQRIGEEVSETLEYTPAKLEVLQHVRLKYRCDSDGLPPCTRRLLRCT